MTFDDFLQTLSKPAQRALKNEQIDTKKKLASYSEKELLKLHGLGKTSLPKIKNYLENE